MLKESQSLALMVNEAIKDSRKLKGIISLLYDLDMKKRFIAAKALGEVAKIKPEFIKQVWRVVSFMHLMIL